MKMNSSQAIENGEVFLKNRRPILLGVSPCNPHYYNVENLRRLFQFGVDNSDKVLLFIPNRISEHNHRAIGSKTPEKSARVKANRLRNKCRDVIEGMEQQGGCISALKYVEWMQEVEPSNEYEKALNYVENLYEANDVFRTDVRESTVAALRCLKNGRKKRPSSDGNECENVFDLEEAVKYLLKELAFFSALPSIKEECEEFVVVYHRSWPILVKFFDGDYDGIPKPYLGFVVLEDENEQRGMR